MAVKERLLVIKLYEKKKKNPKFFDGIEVDAKIVKKLHGESDNK